MGEIVNLHAKTDVILGRRKDKYYIYNYVPIVSDKGYQNIDVNW